MTTDKTMSEWLSLLGILCCHSHLSAAIHHPLREYSGSTFFNRWDYYGHIDDITFGNVTHQDRANANSKGLTFISGAGNAVIRADDTTNIASTTPVYRNSIRLTSQDAYAPGSLILIDAVHIPFGCSVWPSFWTLGIGARWPAAGEIDVIEAINMMGNNQVSVHAIACNITQMFQPQQLILLTTLCGVWAGAPSIYGRICQTPTGNGVLDNVASPGSSTYDDAYSEIRHIRSYVAEGSQPYPAFTTSTSTAASTSTSSSSTSSHSQSGTTSARDSRPSNGSPLTTPVNWGFTLMTLVAIGVAL